MRKQILIACLVFGFVVNVLNGAAANECISTEILRHTPPSTLTFTANKPVIGDFNRTGPHSISLITRARGFRGYCRIELYVVDNKSGQQYEIWSSGRWSFGGEVYEGERKRFELDGIRYEFHLNRCDGRILADKETQVTIIRDMSLYDGGRECSGVGAAIVETMAFEPVGEPSREVLHSYTVGACPSGKVITESFSRINSVSFDLKNENAVEGKIKLGIPRAELEVSAQRKWDNTVGLTTGQSRTSTKTVPVSCSTCARWKVEVFEMRQRYLVSIPGRDIDDVPMIVTLYGDVNATPDPDICPPTGKQ